MEKFKVRNKEGREKHVAEKDNSTRGSTESSGHGGSQSTRSRGNPTIKKMES